jgi:hypothetical protein
MPRTWMRVSLGLIGALALALPARAQVVQSVQFGGGVFLPRGYDARIAGDTLVADLTAFEPLLFDIKDFRSGVVFGEWNVAFGPHVEVAGDISYLRRTVPSVYRNLVNDAQNGAEIRQDLRLQMAPVMAVVRFLPVGRPGDVQPYVGAGMGIVNWRYSEVGDFVDTADYSIFNYRYIASGHDTAGVVLGGVRAPIGGDIYAFNIEYRYQFGSGNTGGADVGFLGDKIDLSGGILRFGVMVRF